MFAESTKTKVGVVGLGHIGLPIALAIASRDQFQVVGVDLEERIREISESDFSSPEPGLDDLLIFGLSHGTFSYTSDTAALRDCELIFVCVGTPSRKDGTIDTAQIESVFEALAIESVRSPKRRTLVIKSTLTPATFYKIRDRMFTEYRSEGSTKRKVDFELIVNPEFSSEGKALEGLFHPDRIVIGTRDDSSAKKMREFYERFYSEGLEGIQYIETTYENAILIKSASNLFLSLKVGCINEISRICEETPNADIDVVANGIGLDKRVGTAFLQAGPGWGGSCFGKDDSALLRYAKEIGLQSLHITEACLTSNDLQKQHVVDLIEKYAGSPGSKKIGVLGLAFKTGTDDVRDSPALHIISDLISKGAEVRAYDTLQAIQNFNLSFSKPIQYFTNLENFLNGLDAVVILHQTKESTGLNPSLFESKMPGGIIIDTRRILDKEKFSKLSLTYVALGANAGYRAKTRNKETHFEPPIFQKSALS